MAMPSLRKTSRAPIAWLLLATAVAGAAGCRQEGPANIAANEQNEVDVATPRIPLPAPPLDRAALLSAIASAASARATGTDDIEAQRLLDGKPFELRLRFGCRGPSNDLRNEQFGWSYDRETGTLRVRATPTISQQDEVAAQIAGEDFEAIEGFWLSRPWLLEAACPATAAVKGAPAPADPEASANGSAEEAPRTPDAAGARALAPLPKIGIAQFFTATDSRTRQRSMRPYEAVKTLEPNAPVGARGFDLVLSGRLQALPDKRVIACVSSGADRPPDCIVSADFDRVRIERADNHELVAEWGSG